MAQGSKDHYPAYSKAELVADGTIHALGVTLSLIAAVYLISEAYGGPISNLMAVFVYSIALILTFVASALYHMTPWKELRPRLRRFDYAAIFLKIAGTYTPIVMLIGTGFSYSVLVLVWALAVYGMIQKLFYWTRPGLASTLLYLGLGWISVVLVWPMIQHLPTLSCWLIVIGGLTYSAGVIFHRWESLKYSNAIWHAFVLTASGFFFFAIFMGVSAPVT